jgi:hypothetical protein
MSTRIFTRLSSRLSAQYSVQVIFAVSLALAAVMNAFWKWKDSAVSSPSKAASAVDSPLLDAMTLHGRFTEVEFFPPKRVRLDARHPHLSVCRDAEAIIDEDSGGGRNLSRCDDYVALNDYHRMGYELVGVQIIAVDDATDQYSVTLYWNKQDTP